MQQIHSLFCLKIKKIPPLFIFAKMNAQLVVGLKKRKAILAAFERAMQMKTMGAHWTSPWIPCAHMHSIIVSADSLTRKPPLSPRVIIEHMEAARPRIERGD